MREAWLICRAWLTGIKNIALSLLRGDRSRRGSLLSLAMMVVLGYLVFRGMAGFLVYIRQNLAGLPNREHLWRAVCLNLATSLSLASLLFLFMTALGTAIATLLEGKGVEFLLSQPIPARTVFAVKFAEALAAMMASLAPFILPSWLALGTVVRAGTGFYLMVILSLLCGAILFLGPAAIILLMVTRFLARQRIRQAAMSLSLLAGLVFVIGLQLLNSLAARSSLGNRILLGHARIWSAAGTSFLPHVWMARAPLAALSWIGLRLANTALPLVLVSTLMYLAAVATAERLYLVGWSTAQENIAVTPQPIHAREKAPRLGGPFIALLRKDFLLVRREPLLWYNVAVSVVVVGFFIWNVSALGLGRGSPPPWLGVFYAGLVVLGTAGWNAQIGGISISREGANWWLLQISPQRAEHILAAKFTFAFLPQLAFVSAANLVLAVWPGISGFCFWTSLPVGVALSAGVTALSLLFDALAPNFHLRLEGKWSGGRNTGGGKVALTSLIGLMLVAVAGTALALPSYYRALPCLRLISARAAMAIGIAAFVGEIATVIGISWYVGVARLRRLMNEAG